MSRTPRVSVVIPCYGYGSVLAEAVESVLAQTYRDFEIAIVDDGSPDDTAEVAQRVIAEHRDASITLLRRPNSGQPAVARNTGIARTRGELILCLDADDLLEPAFLDRCVAALDAHPEASIAYGGQLDFHEDGTEEFHPHGPYDLRVQAHVNLIGIASLFRRAAWVAVGGYPTDVPGYEDWAFWNACGAHGHYGIHVPDAVFRYRVKDGGMAGRGIERDAAHKARIVLANASLYTELQVLWAQQTLAGEPSALAASGPIGRIPVFRDDPGRPAAGPPPPVAPPLAPATGPRTIARVEELVDDPALLAQWAAVSTTDETLVVLAPGADPDECARRFLASAETASVDVEAVDVVLLTAPLEAAQVRALATSADALLSSRDVPPDLASLDLRLAA